MLSNDYVCDLILFLLYDKKCVDYLKTKIIIPLEKERKKNYLFQISKIFSTFQKILIKLQFFFSKF